MTQFQATYLGTLLGTFTTLMLIMAMSEAIEAVKQHKRAKKSAR